MITFKSKPPILLYLHGLGSHPGDAIQGVLEGEGFKIVAPDLTALAHPEVTIKEVIRLSKGVDIVLGFSMGGFLASCIPGSVRKLYVNPAFYFPYILLHKTGDRKLFEDYMKIAGKYQFKDSPVIPPTLVYWAKDKTQPLLTFQTFYRGGKTLEGLKGHVPEEKEIKGIIIPELR